MGLDSPADRGSAPGCRRNPYRHRLCAAPRAARAADDAARAEAFVRQYYRWVVARRPRRPQRPRPLRRGARALRPRARRARRASRRCASTTPSSRSTAGSRRTRVVEIVTDDMPFLVDSVAMELTRRGSAIHLVHPVDHASGATTRAGCSRSCPGARPTALAESLIHVEIDRQTDPAELDALARTARARARRRARRGRGLAGDARSGARASSRSSTSGPPPVDAGRARRGQRPARVDRRRPLHLPRLPRVRAPRPRTARTCSRAVPGTGLGILRQRRASRSRSSFAQLPPEVRRAARASRTCST